jgi:hypothetical protein
MVKLRSNRAATAGIESKADGTQSSWGDDNSGSDSGGDDNGASRTAHATRVISASSAINHGVGFGHRESKQQGDDCIFQFCILPNDHARDDLRQPRNGANDVAASEHEMNVQRADFPTRIA